MSNDKKIVALETLPSKSHKDVDEQFLDALEFCRQNEVVSVGLIIQTSLKTETSFVITEKSNFPMLLGGVERFKDRLKEKWKENEQQENKSPV